MPLSRLPTEITLHITNYLTHSHVTSASLVCRAWRLALIPVLYRSVQLDSDDRAVQFANTVTSGGVTGVSPHIPRSVRFLRIVQHFRMNGDITNLGFDLLNPCMTYFTGLRGLYFHVTGDIVLNNPEFIKLAQTWCPKLETVDLHIQNIDYQTQIGKHLLTTLFDFKNLVSFSLSSPFISSGISVESLGSLESLAANCPRLEIFKLDLSFRDYKGVEFYYTPDIVANSFGKSTMPFLHTLHLCDILGQQLENFSDFPPTGSHPFRDFLLRHPHIKGFKIGYSATDTKSPNINPENLARAFPSLKYFSAPKFLCAKLWRSTLANRIECLSIQRGVWDFEGEPELPPMPMLRQLRIDEPDPLEALKLMGMIMPVACGIEHLRTETHDIPYSFVSSLI
ncbi:unnamed protein product [Rhizoctonia solani]|uniref:F-box domain-containing protein n=1 Tax=Rhizoctonia solani TaxID=456999 RepID=A0A8H2X8R3_9AGAM|nr:unnamed protein product [Rhizoctonia solani]